MPGGFCPGGTNGQVTPLKSQQNFWRSSTNATQLYACPTGSCKGTPYYSGDAVGDAACLNGTRGPVCAVCDTGYYLFSGGCACAPLLLDLLETCMPHRFLPA